MELIASSKVTPDLDAGTWHSAVAVTPRFFYTMEVSIKPCDLVLKPCFDV